MEEMIADFFVDSKQKDSRDVRVHNNDAKFLRSSYDFLYHTRSNRPILAMHRVHYESSVTYIHTRMRAFVTLFSLH